MRVIAFEDGWVHRLAPVTTGRPAMAISCGSYRLVDLLERLGSRVESSVRPHLREVMAADFPTMTPRVEKPRDAENDDGPTVLVNARLVPNVALFERLATFVASGRPGMVRFGDSIAAAILAPGDSPPSFDLDERDWLEYFGRLNLEAVSLDLPLFEYPHDVIRYHPDALRENLADRLSWGEYRELADGLFIAEGATLDERVVIDTSDGPIVLERDASIGPFCYLSGPAHIGRRARVLEHASIKDAVALGHTTKVGGEVEASTIEPFTNKQHHGFLGHSYIGSWVNLGAGTSNSDLKNTYGPVSMEYDGRKVSTGMQFVGCLIGDYSKTAVNTSIFTGKTIGTCSMVYGFVTTNVPSFVNYARSFGQVTEVPVDVEIATQSRMFKRRKVTQRPCDIQLLHDMYELTNNERQLANEPLSL